MVLVLLQASPGPRGVTRVSREGRETPRPLERRVGTGIIASLLLCSVH